MRLSKYKQHLVFLCQREDVLVSHTYEEMEESFLEILY